MPNPRHLVLIALTLSAPIVSACSSTETPATSQKTSGEEVADASVDGGGTDRATEPEELLVEEPLDPAAPNRDGGGFEPGQLPGGGYISIVAGDGGVLNLLCGNEICACADGKDNDADGVADGFDDECTGAYDNDEQTFSTGVPGDNRDPKWQDCFFDGNSGAGDDGCRYHTDCITGKATAESDPKKCSISDSCVNFCQPMVPPGCDCFGCCDVTVDGEQLSILVSDTCSTEDIGDATKCPRCTPTPGCNNECGECELCVGKTLADLPAKCFDGAPPPVPGEPTAPPPPANTCDGDVPACSSNADCGSQQYCSLGCCRVIQYVR
ncbi:MAG: hypothetical protein RJA70_2842 [Pseudomonadota bacterium]|jgi:hypothetical protein